jgi:hypothetical protein
MKKNEEAPFHRAALVSFEDLRALRIFNNNTTLYRAQQKRGFPEGFLLAPQVRRWTWGEVEDWLQQRRELSAGIRKQPAEAAHRARRKAHEQARRKKARAEARRARRRAKAADTHVEAAE